MENFGLLLNIEKPIKVKILQKNNKPLEVSLKVNAFYLGLFTLHHIEI